MGDTNDTKRGNGSNQRTEEQIKEIARVRSSLYRVKSTCETLVGLLEDDVMSVEQVKDGMFKVYDKNFNA